MSDNEYEHMYLKDKSLEQLRTDCDEKYNEITLESTRLQIVDFLFNEQEAGNIFFPLPRSDSTIGKLFVDSFVSGKWKPKSGEEIDITPTKILDVIIKDKLSSGFVKWKKAKTMKIHKDLKSTRSNQTNFFKGILFALEKYKTEPDSRGGRKYGKKSKRRNNKRRISKKKR